MTSYFSQIAMLNQLHESDICAAVHRDILGMALRLICEYMKASPQNNLAVRKLYYSTADNREAARKVLWMVCGCELPPDDLDWLNECLCAHFRKKNRRKAFTPEEKHEIWLQGSGKCAICDTSLPDGHFDVDHKVPWDYVGDELSDNYQPLCRTCNLKKSKNTATAVENIIFSKGGNHS